MPAPSGSSALSELLDDAEDVLGILAGSIDDGSSAVKAVQLLEVDAIGVVVGTVDANGVVRKAELVVAVIVVVEEVVDRAPVVTMVKIVGVAAIGEVGTVVVESLATVVVTSHMNGRMNTAPVREIVVSVEGSRHHLSKNAFNYK